MLNDIEQFQTQSQWTASSREIVQLMQSVLPPPDPHRYEPLPGAPLPPDIDGDDGHMSVDTDDVIEVSDDEDGDAGLSVRDWALVIVGVTATAALWAWLLT
jgi:hypothetical protein